MGAEVSGSGRGGAAKAAGARARGLDVSDVQEENTGLSKGMKGTWIVLYKE